VLLFGELPGGGRSAVAVADQSLRPDVGGEAGVEPVVDGPDFAALRCFAEPRYFRRAAADDEQAGILETGERPLQAQLRQLQAARLGLSMRRAQSGFLRCGSVRGYARGYAHGKTSISSDLYAIIIVINISIACPQGAGKIMHMMLDVRH